MLTLTKDNWGQGYQRTPRELGTTSHWNSGVFRYPIPFDYIYTINLPCCRLEWCLQACCPSLDGLFPKLEMVYLYLPNAANRLISIGWANWCCHSAVLIILPEVMCSIDHPASGFGSILPRAEQRAWRHHLEVWWVYCVYVACRFLWRPCCNWIIEYKENWKYLV